MKRAPLHRNVVITGLTSFFTDVSSEMVYPLLQAFVSAILQTQKALIGPVIGIMEGIAESTASLLKVFAGYYSDRVKKRKAPAILGYGLSIIGKGFLLLATPAAWFFVLISRFVERVGKGIRTAPRDALISESTPKEEQGRAFGIQRGMDFAGATMGSLIAILLVRKFMEGAARNAAGVGSSAGTGAAAGLAPFYTFFLISLIPAALGVIVLFFLRETRGGEAKKDRPKPNLRLSQYNTGLRVFFLAQFVFTLGNSSNQFLLLRSMNLGYSLSVVIGMYLLMNLISTLLSPVFGSLSDRIGRKRLLVIGYIMYGIVYGAFGFIGAEAGWVLWIFWPVYGVYYALTEGVEKAFVADLAPRDSKATALGFYHTIVGIGLLPASIIAGFLFSWNNAAPFIWGSACAAITVIILIAGIRQEKSVPAGK